MTNVGSPSVRQCMFKQQSDKGAGIYVAITSGADTLSSIHNSGYGRTMQHVSSGKLGAALYNSLRL